MPKLSWNYLQLTLRALFTVIDFLAVFALSLTLRTKPGSPEFKRESD